MRKKRIKHGRHPIVMRDLRLLNRIIKAIQDVDPATRLIPTRFNRHQGSPRKPEMIKNPENPQELFLKVIERKYIQRFKIETSSKHRAKFISGSLCKIFDEMFPEEESKN